LPEEKQTPRSHKTCQTVTTNKGAVDPSVDLCSSDVYANTLRRKY